MAAASAPIGFLGVRNPALAFEALGAADYACLTLPCEIVAVKCEAGRVEVSAIALSAPMRAIGNPTMDGAAGTARDKLMPVVTAL